MGIIPLQYMNGSNTESNGLTGKEQISIELPAELTPGCEATVTTDTGVKFSVQVRFDTEVYLHIFTFAYSFFRLSWRTSSMVVSSTTWFDPCYKYRYFQTTVIYCKSSQKT